MTTEFGRQKQELLAQHASELDRLKKGKDDSVTTHVNELKLRGEQHASTSVSKPCMVNNAKRRQLSIKRA